MISPIKLGLKLSLEEAIKFTDITGRRLPYASSRQRESWEL
jgi:hypothetical protein